MANLNGTNVASTIRPFTTDDKFATAVANEIQGGLHNVDLIADMLAIPEQRRELGMLCSVKEDGKVYKLITNPNADSTTNSDWEEFGSSADVTNIKVDSNTTLSMKLDQIDAALYNKFAIFELYPAYETGIAPVELTVPFKAEASFASLSVLSSVVLTQNITVELQYFDTVSSAWLPVSTLTVPKTTTTYTIVDTFSTAKTFNKDTKFRCDVKATQDDMTSVQITLAIKMII